MTSPQAQPLKTLICLNAIVELYSDRIVVHKKGLFSRFSFAFSGRTLTISLYRLRDIKFYKGGIWANGAIRLVTVQGNIFLFFAPKAYLQALAMNDTIEDLLSRQRIFSELKPRLRRT